MANENRNRIIAIIVLVLVAVGSVVFINAPQSVTTLDSADFNYQIVIDQKCGVNTNVEDGTTPKEAGFAGCSYSTVTSPVTSGAFSLDIDEINVSNNQLFVCTRQNGKKICLADGEEVEIRPFIKARFDAPVNVIAQEEGRFIGSMSLLVDAENGFDLDYKDRTGLQFKEEFEAPIKVLSNFDTSLDVGIESSSKTLILEGESEEQIVDPKLLTEMNSYALAVSTSRLGFNEVDISPYILFQKDADKFFVSSGKDLFIQFNVQPKVEGQPLKPGRVGVRDPDTGVSKITTGVVESVDDVSDEPVQILFLLIIGTIMTILIVNIIRNK